MRYNTVALRSTCRIQVFPLLPKHKMIDKTHWDNLYARLHDAYVECLKHNNPTYEQKLAQVLDHMIINKKHLYIR